MMPPLGSVNDKEVVTYSIRQLPIHMACWDLGRLHSLVDYERGQNAAANTATTIVHENTAHYMYGKVVSDKLNQLINHLVVTYPEACMRVDHTQHLPIQLAVIHGAYSSTISMLLVAYPEGVQSKDPIHGHSLWELNRYSNANNPYHEQTRQVLGLDVDFWKKSKQEATSRMQQQQQQSRSSLLLQQQQETQQQEQQERTK
jgi:hypothetical protein